MTENEVATGVVDAIFAVHSHLGLGLLESIYETCLFCELQNRGLQVERQVLHAVEYDGLVMEGGFRLDLLVEGILIVEVKSVEALEPIQFKQVLTYLKISDLRLGILVNFNDALIKNGIKRLINGQLPG